MEAKIDTAELTKPFEQDCLETRAGGGGRQFTYVAAHAIIRRLNRACSYQWSFRITEQVWKDDVLMCSGELEIPTLGTRAAVGVQRYIPNSGEDTLKGAATDCLKKCASLFGVGLELYGADVEGGEAPRKGPAQPTRPQQSGGGYGSQGTGYRR